MKNRRAARKKTSNDEAYREMLEIYTVVPPSPFTHKRKRRSGSKGSSIKK
jgi:hypothetical protein